MRGILHNRFLHTSFILLHRNARNITSQTRERERKRCASRARRESLLARGIFGRINPLARRFCRQKQKKKKKKRRRELFKIHSTETADTTTTTTTRRIREREEQTKEKMNEDLANAILLRMVPLRKSCCGKHCSIAQMPKTISRSNKNSFKPSSGLKKADGEAVD